MGFNALKQLIYGLYLTNSFGLKLKISKNVNDKKRLRLAYAEAQLKTLNITVKLENREKLPYDGSYVVVVNHRSIIDPPIVEVALRETRIFGPWIAKKELYYSFFFGLFVRHAGAILVDRKKIQMNSFFGDIKQAVQEKKSIFIFPEGTRNKTNQSITTFKEGSRLIALKNRLPILPLYIKTNTDTALKEALQDNHLDQVITVSVGDLIAYKEKKPLDEIYKKSFNLEF